MTLYQDISKIFNEFERYITPTEIKGFMYCNRFSYYQNYMGINQHAYKKYKVSKGVDKHNLKEKQNKNLIRKSIHGKLKYSNTEIYSKKHGIKGVVDEIYYVENNQEGQLGGGSLIPLDYKFAEYKYSDYLTYRFQMGLYIIMMEEMFQCKIDKYYLVFTRSNNKLMEYTVDQRLRTEIINVLMKYREVLQGYYPEGTEFHSRCEDCCYNKICIQ